MNELQRVDKKEAVVIWQYEGNDIPEHSIFGDYKEDKWVDSVSGEETIERYLYSKVNIKLSCLKLEDWNGEFYTCYSCSEKISKKYSVRRIKLCEVRVLQELVYRPDPDAIGLIIVHCLVTREYLDS